jgi:hypothetical protein
VSVSIDCSTSSKRTLLKNSERLIELHKYYVDKIKSGNDQETEDFFYGLQLVDFILMFLYSIDDYELNEHINMCLSLNNIDKSEVIRVSKSYMKAYGIEEALEKSPKNIEEKEFKTVSQNPSESESEEMARGNKRMKINDVKFNVPSNLEESV